MARTTAEQMRHWLAWRAQHGWTWSETARRSGHAARKLRWWQCRLASARATEAASGAFVAVEIVGRVSGPAAALEVTTRSGHRVSVPAGFDAEHLRQLLRALGATC